MSKFEVKSISEIHNSIQKSDSGKFTTAEASELLNILISDSARYKLADFYKVDVARDMEEPYSTAAVAKPAVVTVPTEKEVQTIAENIYTRIVKDWRYESTTLEVCRKAKFSRAMVLDIVQAVNKEMAAASVVKAVSPSLEKSLLRVAANLQTDLKSMVKSVPEFETVAATKISYPERVYLFLKSVSEDRKGGE